MKAREMNSKDSKIYIVGFDRRMMDSHELRKAKLGLKKSRMFFFPMGETIIENLVSRRSRPHNEYRKVTGDILDKLGLDKDMKFHWDQKAGCTCGCSPGFVLEGDHNHNIFVDYADPSQVIEHDGIIEVRKPKVEVPPFDLPEGLELAGDADYDYERVGELVIAKEKMGPEIEVEPPRGFEITAAA